MFRYAISVLVRTHAKYRCSRAEPWTIGYSTDHRAVLPKLGVRYKLDPMLRASYFINVKLS